MDIWGNPIYFLLHLHEDALWLFWPDGQVFCSLQHCHTYGNSTLFLFEGRWDFQKKLGKFGTYWSYETCFLITIYVIHPNTYQLECRKCLRINFSLLHPICPELATPLHCSSVQQAQIDLLPLSTIQGVLSHIGINYNEFLVFYNPDGNWLAGIFMFLWKMFQLC